MKKILALGLIFLSQNLFSQCGVPLDYCIDDPIENLTACPTQGYNANSGQAGFALILLTDDNPGEITFVVNDRDGVLMFDETNFPGAPGTLSANTAYVLYDNPCFGVNETVGIPGTMDIDDSANNGISDLTGSLTGAGVYTYFYAADAMENITNDNTSNGVDYVSVGYAGFPSFYTTSTNRRVNPPSHNTTNTTITFPAPSDHEYVSTGSWSGNGVSNSGTVSKTYFSGFVGLERTITVPSGNGTFNPSIAGVGANTIITYSYDNYYGSTGPAPCNTNSATNISVDVHARPTLSLVQDQTCDGATYDVTINVNLGSYNVSVDEDGATSFTVTGSGGTVSPASLAGTGANQITITGIPIGNNWSIDVTDPTGLSCGLLGTSGDCAAVLTTNIPLDYCEDDAVQALTPANPYDATSGQAGFALILVTDDWASEITFNVFDFDGNLMFDETSVGPLANNSLYVLFDNPCFDVTQTAGIPGTMRVFDSANDGIFDNTSNLVGAGVYTYFYAADGMENITNDDNGNGVEHLSLVDATALGFPSFYTAATNQRTNPPTHNGGTTDIVFPPASSHEYVSGGTWSGVGVSNVANTTKTYFSGFTGLERTITIPNSYGEFDPSVPSVGPNSIITYTYYDYYGSTGPAPCNTTSTTPTSVDIHARPIITPVNDQLCDGSPYTVTLDVDFGTYNISVDEDGATAFSITATGGTVAPTSINATGTQQIVISNIPNGNNWSINITDPTGLTCGATMNGNCLTVLPIELVSFDATLIGKRQVELSWVTASEINSSHFIVQKTKDLINWEDVVQTIAAGNSTQTIEYSDFDNDPLSGQSYYRLLLFDLNNNVEYSDLKSISIGLDNNLIMYPNPVDSYLYVQLEDDNENQIQIFNLLGQDITKEIFVQSKNELLRVIDVSTLATGAYYIKVGDLSSSFYVK